jgi:hypothetical protein
LEALLRISNEPENRPVLVGANLMVSVAEPPGEMEYGLVRPLKV